MIISNIFESNRHDKGKLLYNTKLDVLYHLTNYIGLTNMINTNSLSTQRYRFISTTYNPRITAIFGRSHYDFKFILDAKKLAKDYGIFRNTAYTTEIGSYGSRTPIKLVEYEIAVNTTMISPLTYYSDTIVISIDMFSRSFVQWMFYKNYNDQGMALLSLKKWIEDGNNVLRYNGDGEHRPLNSKEQQLLSFMFDIAKNKNISYPTALDKIVRKFNIKDFFKDLMDSDTVKREKRQKFIVDYVNKTLTIKPYSQIPPDTVKEMVKKIVDALYYGNNFKSELLYQMEKRNLFTSVLPPVVWSGLISDLVKNAAMDEIIDTLEYMKKEAENKIRTIDAFKDSDIIDTSNQKHVKTGMAGIGDGYGR